MPTQPSWAGRAVTRDASRLSIPLLLLLLLPFVSLDSISLRLALKRCQPWTKTPELTRLLPRSALSHQPLRFFPRPVKAGLYKVGAVGQVEERRGGAKQRRKQGWIPSSTDYWEQPQFFLFGSV
ncbi:hypothetical protein V8C44DRAFT_304200 [Trichoderma aethiopicum]